MKNSELAHLWAHQSRSQGTGSSLSFSGPVLRSYSTAIWELVQTKDGLLAVLNATDYSVSTSRHQHYARQAVSHLPSVEVYGVRQGEPEVVPKDAEGRADKKWVREQIKTSLAKAAEWMERAGRARSPDVSRYSESQADFFVRNAETLAKWFKVRMPKVELGDLVARAEEIRKQEAARRKWFEAKLLKENAKKIEAWQNNEPGAFIPYGVGKVFLRKRTPGTVETSKGAVIPWDDAVRLFRFALARRKKGWRRNGETFAVGPYQLDAVNEHGIVAGCHRIGFDEMERLAKKEGVAFG
ncbi:MAG TPA: hypothetical protein P5204_00170 [Kiritimatiellia bacterium]|nr:hypothetical protein [Kiritimatiellia bacterium]